jgi:hypothetical protein
MPGFWELPMWEVDGWPGGLAEQPLDAPQLPLEAVRFDAPIRRVRHTITTNRLEIRVHAAALRKGAKLPNSRWVSATQFSRLPVTTLTRKALAIAGTA